MFVNEDLNNSKSSNSKLNFPFSYSPYIHKKKSIGNLYTEPRKIPMEKNSSNSRNKMKQKMSNYSINSNIIIKSGQNSLSKSLKNISKEIKKGRNMHQSYAKFNSKLYLKKNAIPSLSSFHDINNPLIKNSTTNIIKTNTNNSKSKNKETSATKNKNKSTNNKNIKLIFGKSSNNSNINNISSNNNLININSQSYGNINNIKQNNYHTHNTHNNSKTPNNNLLKKSGGSATELFCSNFIKKSNTKNIPELNNLPNNFKNQIGYIFSTAGNCTNKPFLSPQNIKGQKIIFLKNEKNKKEPKDKSRKNSKNNSKAKDLQKKALSQKSEKNINLDDDINNNINLEDKNNSVQYLLRNTYNNVKIYPTTVLNNKIIVQEELKKEKISSYSVNNSVNTSITHNTSSLDKKSTLNENKINKNISISNNKEILNNNGIKKEFNTVEEVHFMLVKTIHNARNIVFLMDKSEY